MMLPPHFNLGFLLVIGVINTHLLEDQFSCISNFKRKYSSTCFGPLFWFLHLAACPFLVVFSSRRTCFSYFAEGSHLWELSSSTGYDSILPFLPFLCCESDHFPFASGFGLSSWKDQRIHSIVSKATSKFIVPEWILEPSQFVESFLIVEVV